MGKKSHRRTTSRAGTDEPVDSTLAELWATISAGDMLTAEIQTAAVLALPYLAGRTRKEADDFASSLVAAAARRQPSPVGAAFYRLLMSLGSPAVKRAASGALGVLTDEGVYPPEWVTDIGKPVPGRAWHRYDVFCDDEVIVVTFRYGETEHALLVSIDLTTLPVAHLVGVSPEAAILVEGVRDRDDPLERCAEISLAEARRRIEAPLARASRALVPDLSAASIAFLPVARSRVRRLPADGAGTVAEFTAADRAAAADDFMRSPQAAEAGDAETARFWAEVLTGYSSRIRGEPPAQVGPRKLAAILLSHVPTTFTLTPAQRAGLQTAVTVWTRWAADRQELDEAATEHLVSPLPKVFDDFESAYDDPGSSAARHYLRDLAASDSDVALVASAITRRTFAAPLPELRDAGLAAIDATDPDGRAVLVAAEFATCRLDGMTSKQFVAAATRVVEELWHDDPPVTWETARRLLAEGNSRHDIIHTLARR